MFKKHCKTYHNTMFFLEPSPAQHLQKNIKKQIGNHPKILKTGARRPPETASEKHPPKNIKKNGKIPKMCDFGVPKISHFRYLFVFGSVFWGMFFGSGFRRPPGTILEDFGVVSEVCLYVFLKMLGGARF